MRRAGDIRRRSRSRDADRAKRPKTVPNQWDEGVGGYIPPSSSGLSSSLGSLPALTAPNQASVATINLPTIGEAAQRRVIVGNIIKDKSQKDISDMLSACIASKLPLSSNSAKQPVLSIQFLTLSAGLRSVMAELRTPNAAAACMLLNGQVFEGQSLTTRRPRDFLGSEPDIEAAEVAPEACPVPVHLMRLSGFPDLMGVQDVRDLLQLFGPLRSLAMAQDQGKIRGHGTCQFENPMDSVACMLALNGWTCGPGVLKFEMQKIEIQIEEKPAGVQMSVTAKIAANPVLASQIRAGREMGARPSTVVQMINAVYAEDLLDDQEYLALIQEVKEEGSRFGQIEQVRIPRPKRDLSHVEGCGKIFVQFKDLTASRKFQLEMNGRLFDNSRVVCAAFYPLDRFLQGKYTLYSS